MNISREQAKWLLAEYNPIRGYGRVDKYIDKHVQAMSIIKGHPVGRPECSCSYGATARIASSLYEQHEAQIIAAAAEPVIENEGSNQKQAPKGRPKRKVQ